MSRFAAQIWPLPGKARRAKYAATPGSAEADGDPAFPVDRPAGTKHRVSRLIVCPYPVRSAMDASILRLRPSDDAEGDPGALGRGRQQRYEHEDLSYKVEVWNKGKTAVETLVAMTVSASIGYAAYYAATREFADRYITLRHKNSIISRWNGPGH